MDIRDRRALKEYAAARLNTQSPSPRRLAFMHIAISSALLLVLTGLNFYLSHQVESTVGLSGIGLRSVLQTAQMVLQYAVNIALPFWQIGFVFTAIRMVRNAQAQNADLAEGFRRFGPVLRLMLLRGLIYGLLAFPCVYLSSFIYMLTPAAQKLMTHLMPLAEAGADMVQLQTALFEMPPEQLIAVSWPVFVIFGSIYGLVAAVLFYRFRVADQLIMDRPGTGALAALILSSHLTKKNRLALLRLDLSFWWYYALQLLAGALCYLDVVLMYVEIPMQMDAGTVSLISYILGLAAQVLLFTYAGSYLHTTWAVAYDSLLQQFTPPTPQPAPTPKKLPWDEYNT